MNTLQDPNQSGMEWRVILAVVLSLAALFGFQLLMPTVPDPLPIMEERTPAPSAAPPIASAPLAAANTADTQAEAREVRMENASIQLVWSSVRSGLKSARILDYRGEDGEALEMLPQGIDGTVVRPFEVQLKDSVYAGELKAAVYEIVDAPAGGLYRGGEPLIMKYVKGAVQVVRRIRLSDVGYLLEMETEVLIDGRRVPYALTLGAGIGPNGLDTAWQGDFSSPRIVVWQNGASTEFDHGSLDDKSESLKGDIPWVAFDSHYFGYALLGGGASIGEVDVFSEAVILPAEEGQAVSEPTPLLRANASVEGGGTLRVFLGPKKRQLLSDVEGTLVQLINYGKYLGFLVRPLVACLRFVNSYVGNYGFSIILLTLLINIALFPIRYKQMVSMKKMSAIQPQLKAIQEKYKKMKRDDPRRLKMNEEVMAFYKERGVNPLAGCLPLLVQMPFLFAFYTMLSITIELRGAPFIWWIQDLSKADPYYVTPVVMGASMLFQQQMTPTPGDAMQRRMMMFMPIIFTFFFLNVSSGLAVYFLFSNLFGMAFQLGYQKLSGNVAEGDSGGAKGRKRKK